MLLGGLIGLPAVSTLAARYKPATDRLGVPYGCSGPVAPKGELGLPENSPLNPAQDVLLGPGYLGNVGEDVAQILGAGYNVEVVPGPTPGSCFLSYRTERFSVLKLYQNNRPCEVQVRCVDVGNKSPLEVQTHVQEWKEWLRTLPPPAQ